MEMTIEQRQALALAQARRRRAEAEQNQAAPTPAREGVGNKIAGAVGDAGRWVGTALGNVGAGIVSAPREIYRLAAQASDPMPVGTSLDPNNAPDAPFPFNKLPSYKGARDWLSDPTVLGYKSPIGFADVQPKSGMGKAAMTVTEFALDPTSALRKGARNVVQDVATNAAAGVGYVAGEQAAGTVGGLAGAVAGKGVTTGVANRARELGLDGQLPQARAEQMIKRRVSGVDAPLLDDAMGAQNSAKQFGYQLTGNEALNIPTLNTLASAAGQSPAGSKLTTFFNNRAPKIESAVENAATQVGGNPAMVDTLTRRLELAANKGLKDADAFRTEQYRDNIEDLTKVQVPAPVVASIQEQLKKELETMPSASRQANSLRDIERLITEKGNVTTNAAVLNNALTDMQARLRTKAPDPSALDKQQKEIYTRYYTQLHRELEGVSPAYQRAEKQYGETSALRVKPIRENKVLDALRTKEFDETPTKFADFANAIKSRDVSPQSVYMAGKQISAVDPDVWQRGMAEYMRQVWDKAQKPKAGMGGKAVNAGAIFVRGLGTPKEKANFFAGLRVIDEQKKLRPNSSKDALQNTEIAVQQLLRGLERTDVTPGMGSPTQMREGIAREAGDNLLAEMTGLNPATLTRMVGLDAFTLKENFRNRVYEEIINILTRPDTVEVISELAKSKNPNRTLQILQGVARQGVQATRENQQLQQQQQEQP